MGNGATDEDDEDMEDAGPAPTVTSVAGPRQQDTVLQYEAVFSNSLDDTDTEWHDGGALGVTWFVRVPTTRAAQITMPGGDDLAGRTKDDLRRA